MAWTYKQLFNDLNNGDLNGQDSPNPWSGDTEFDVQTSVKYEGAKAVEVVRASGSGSVSISKVITGVVDGLVYIAARFSDITDFYVRIDLYEGVNERINIYWQDGALGIRYFNGTELVTYLQPIVVNTWYVLAIDFRASDNKARYNVHNGNSWGGWTDRYNVTSAFTEIDKIFIVAYKQTAAYTFYFDTITPKNPRYIGPFPTFRRL